MRWKIIVANAGIVLIMGLLAYVLMATTLSDVVANPAQRKTDTAHAVRAANARLALDALQFERWLGARAREDAIRDVFGGATIEARQESATVQANRLRDEAVRSPVFVGLAPSLLVFTDAQGKVLGRNGSALMRGEALADIYPVVKLVLQSGETMSDVWVNAQRQEQLLTSLVPVRGEGGEIVGSLAVGVPLNDERLSRTSDLTSGTPLLFGTNSGDKVTILAHSTSIPGELLQELQGVSVTQSVKLAFGSHGVTGGEAEHGEWVYSVGPLDGYRSEHGFLIAAAMTARMPNPSGLLFPIIGATILGLILVVIVGSLLGNYFTQPVSELEDGLLAVINGNQALRFQIEHPELGGLVFRINSLLNALTGVPEDNTDEQGRPSLPANGPPPKYQEELVFDDSFSVAKEVDASTLEALATESEAAYVARLFEEYVTAISRAGNEDPNLTLESFTHTVFTAGASISAKCGSPIRFVVYNREGQVVLAAVPLH